MQEWILEWDQSEDLSSNAVERQGWPQGVCCFRLEIWIVVFICYPDNTKMHKKFIILEKKQKTFFFFFMFYEFYPETHFKL